MSTYNLHIVTGIHDKPCFTCVFPVNLASFAPSGYCRRCFRCFPLSRSRAASPSLTLSPFLFVLLYSSLSSVFTRQRFFLSSARYTLVASFALRRQLLFFLDTFYPRVTTLFAERDISHIPRLIRVLNSNYRIKQIYIFF